MPASFSRRIRAYRSLCTTTRIDWCSLFFSFLVQYGSIKLTRLSIFEHSFLALITSLEFKSCFPHVRALEKSRALFMCIPITLCDVKVFNITNISLRYTVQVAILKSIIGLHNVR